MGTQNQNELKIQIEEIVRQILLQTKGSAGTISSGAGTAGQYAGRFASGGAMSSGAETAGKHAAEFESGGQIRTGQRAAADRQESADSCSVLTLTIVKELMERLEKEAIRRGLKSVFAVCNAQGNPVAVHVMDGAFLVSFDVAVKKAYTAAAVHMSTLELQKLCQPGGTFYGLDTLPQILALGGGVPLYAGGQLAGGLAVSGATGEEDDSMALFGQGVFEQLAAGSHA